MEIRLEVCAGCIESVKAAAVGGAYRVELCSGLSEGGLTPSLGYLLEAQQVEGLKKNVLIRPRGGDFLYSEAELRVILRDIEAVREAGFDGIVVGMLTADGYVDRLAMRECMAAAGEMEVTFHRAFDLCCDQSHALETIIELGCHRILTSGGAATAADGIAALRALVKQSAGRILIMPGCGINADNVAAIVRGTGVTEVHASARDWQLSRMQFRHAGVAMGNADVDEYAIAITSVEKVRDICGVLSCIGK